MSPNEGRARLDLQPVIGGESPYLQQQNYSLEALAKRDAQTDPFASNTPTPPAPSTAPPDQVVANDQSKSINLDRVGVLFARAA
jgi:phage portal protein BeeE